MFSGEADQKTTISQNSIKHPWSVDSVNIVGLFLALFGPTQALGACKVSLPQKLFLW